MKSPPRCLPITNEPISHRSDDSLLRGYQSGDEVAATALYLRYAARLRALAREYCAPHYGGRFDADDIVQSVFRAFFHGARRRAYVVPPGGELWGLLMVLALNKIRNLIGTHRAGKRAVQQTTSLANLDSPALAADDSAAAFLRWSWTNISRGCPSQSGHPVADRGYSVAEISPRPDDRPDCGASSPGIPCPPDPFLIPTRPGRPVNSHPSVPFRRTGPPRGSVRGRARRPP